MYNEEEYFTYTNQQKLKAQQMDTIKSTLDGTPTIDKNAVYLVDFTKCQSVNDMVVILQSVGFSFSPHHPMWEVVKPFVDLDKPIQINQPMHPPAKELKLPKLKTL
jgi:hypothetical protein